MSLPIVIEIAVGLIFIYLTLSLVASEIQEILSALFQWRAEHLKRSIEQLLAGNSTRAEGKERGQNRQAAKTLADRLYDSPLISNLNYEAQGRLASWLRSGLHAIGAVYRILTFSRNVFGNKTSGPSYIPAETFATSLIERLRLEEFQQVLVRSRFNQFIQTEVQLPLHNTVSELRAQVGDETLLRAEMDYFDQELAQVTADLNARRVSLEAALNQILSQLQAFETMATEVPLSDAAIAQSFLRRVRYLRNRLLSGHEQNALLTRLRPTLGDLAALLDPDSPTYAELVELAQREGGAVWGALEKLQQEVIPPELGMSLATLASRAEARVQTTGNELQQLQTELEAWFDRGMERASGVYRRNVKGVGLLIGLAIAFTLNADTFYMFQRLSTDQAIRNSIVQTAEQLEVRGIDSPEALAEDLSIDELSERIEGDLRLVGAAVGDILADYPLPIGRTEAVITAQQAAEANWPIPLIPQRLIGWLITALALSMGASFWFDLLRKVMSVRASGDPPKSSPNA
ncbi:hypothetical protein [Leptolyngbya sp. BC1307]|uniref:hypothetical protein n=1 Tax=Leptolyngbya sp. BC1307 TaxID=2029589 RepID=UPI000EFB7B81|nr:hypothetical protein [Leptolyngbya sp. BC1307]